MNTTRRGFLKAGLAGMAWYSLQSAAPRWLMQSAQGMCPTCFTSDLILVVVNQAGGNDGLNTVVPFTDPLYASNRPTIGLPSNGLVSLDGLNALHPALAPLANWYQQGLMAIVHNVGYVNPNLSHFQSTDYYELGTAPGGPMEVDGWLARYYDHACTGCSQPDALMFAGCGSSTLPKPFKGSPNYIPPAVSSASSYKFNASNDSALRLGTIDALNAIATSDADIGYIQRSQQVAKASVTDIATAAAWPDVPVPPAYPTGSFGNGLKLASQIIRAGFPTKIFFVQQGGYDTHSSQVDSGSPTTGTHADLLGAFAQGINAFLDEMAQSGNLGRVVVMTYSEFGRRVAENGSRGTDHGAGNCSFVIGGPVLGGVYGGQPNLSPAGLISGSLLYNVDFRAIYTRAIEGLFGQPTRAVFGDAAYDGVIAQDLAKIPFLNVRAFTQGWILR